MKLTLTNWQRFQLWQLAGNVQGNLIRIRKAHKILDVVEWSPAERDLIEFKEWPNGRVSWNEAACSEWQIELGDREAVKLLKEIVEAHDGWLAQKYGEVVDLFDQMGLEIPADEDEEEGEEGDATES